MNSSRYDNFVKTVMKTRANTCIDENNDLSNESNESKRKSIRRKDNLIKLYYKLLRVYEGDPLGTIKSVSNRNELVELLIPSLILPTHRTLGLFAHHW